MNFNALKTRAIVIGSSTYRDETFPDLDSVKDNVYIMGKLLQSNLALYPKHCLTYLDRNRKDILEGVRGFSNDPEVELMLIYFSGHGTISLDRKNYYFLLNESDPAILDDTAISIEKLVSVLANRITTILIIDACFSEKAFEFFNARSFFIIASSARDKTSEYPVGEEMSAFTRCLKNTIENGIDNDRSFLAFDDIFGSVRQMLVDEGFPEPRHAEQHTAGSILLFPNNSRSKSKVRSEWVNDLFNSVMNTALPEVRAEINRLNSNIGYNPDNLRLKILLEKFPTFVSLYIRKLFSISQISNDLSFTYFKRIIHFLGLYLLADLSSRRTWKGWLVNPLDYFKDPTFSQIKDLFRTVAKLQQPLFMEELGLAIQDILHLSDEIEKESSTPEALTIQPLVVKLIIRLSFLVNYDFISIWKVEVRKRFLKPDEFTHSLSELRGEEYKEYRSKLQFENECLNTSSVVVFKASSYENVSKGSAHVNLWPLIIDANTLNRSISKPDIYFYQSYQNGQYVYYNVIQDSLGQRLYEQLDRDLPQEKHRLHLVAFENSFTDEQP
jgi:hypothetical protein